MDVTAHSRTDDFLPRLAFPLTVTALVVVAVMTAFETGKQLLHPNISVWGSHVITIIFTSVVGTSVAYSVVRKVSGSNAELARLNRTLRAESRQITLLNEMADLLQSCQSLDEACEVVGHFAMQLLPGDSCSLLMLSESKNAVEAIGCWGDSAPLSRVFSPDDCWGLRRGQVHVVEEGSRLPGHLRPNTWNVCVPLVAQNAVFGLFHVESDRGRPRLEEVSAELKQRLAIAIAKHVSLAIANLRLRETLRNQSIRDPLTGLFNRRYMEESLERELRRAIRHGSRLALVMLDLDHFKAFNDTFGHAAGDGMLRSVGELLRTGVRKEDVPCRYGGEEFVLMLPESSLECACQRAEELRHSFRNIEAPLHDQPPGMITVSMGVAAYPEDASTVNDLLRAADNALYLAKQRGRNQVVSSHDLHPVPQCAPSPDRDSPC